jgi:RimJ/RimL family protein N-acetyltransferase
VCSEGLLCFRGESHMTHAVTIETSRLLLLPWADEYGLELARIYADPEVIVQTTYRRPLSRNESLEVSTRSCLLWQDYGFGPWAAIEKVSGNWVGRIGMNLLVDWPLEDKWEVGWLLDRRYWGRGLATEGGQAGLRFAFEAAKLERIISVTVPDNIRSRRVMEKCGLTYQGELTWRKSDVVWYAIHRTAWTESKRR